MDELNCFFMRIVLFSFILLAVYPKLNADTGENDITVYDKMLYNLYNKVYEVNKDTNFDVDLSELSSGQFSDINYTIYLEDVKKYKHDFTNDQKNTSNKYSYARRKHLIRLKKMAVAYSNPESSHYKNKELKAQIVDAAEYWLTLNPDCINWWWRMIGFPKSMAEFISVIEPHLRTSHPELVQKIADYLLWSWSEEGRKHVGANGTDVAKVSLVGAILKKDDSILKEIMQKASEIFVIQYDNFKEGIQTDYSFNQHGSNGRQLYLAHYGRDYFAGFMYFIEATAGTEFAFTNDQLKLLEDMYLRGISWIIYEGYYDENQTGRFIGRENPADYIKWLKDILSLNTPQKSRLEAIYQWLKNGNTPSSHLSGNRMYWRHDYMIHRRENYFTSVRMTSTRTVGNSAGNGLGLENIHTGDGVNYIRVRGDEYQDLMPDNPEYNWRKIAGITAEQDKNDLSQKAPIWGKGGAGGSNFAGGVSDGTYGAAGFILNRYNISAKKSWFFFDDYYVALGTDIQADRATDDVVTTVNQTRGGKNAERGRDTGGRDWVLHDDIGYYFEDYTGSVKVTNGNIMTLEINHGSAVSDGHYAYVVYPDTGSMLELEQNFSAKPYQIIANRSNFQAVADAEYSIIYIVFYEAGKLDIEPAKLRIESDNKAVLMLRKRSGSTEYQVSVADPLCELSSASVITVTINGSALPFHLPYADVYKGKTLSRSVKIDKVTKR